MAFKLFGAEIDVVNNSCCNMINKTTDYNNIEANHHNQYVSSKPVTKMIKLFGTEIAVMNPITTAATSCITHHKSSSSIVSDHEQEEEEVTKLRISPDASSARRQRHRPYPTSTGRTDRPVWKIRKRLTESDVNGLSRLLVSTKLMEDEVLPLMEAEMRRKVDSGGLKVAIVDDDTGIVHHNMVLKLWPSCSAYVINGSWSRFCKTRNLRAKDEIGLRWDTYNRRFHISLLRKATASPRRTKLLFHITRLQ